MSSSILICGIGGQGTVLASKVLSHAALCKGEKVFSAETIGMAQRGGSVVSHVRIGEDVFSPLIPERGADVMIAFDASEAVRNISYLSEKSTVIVNAKVVQPVSASLTGKFFKTDDMVNALMQVTKNVIVVDTDKACTELGSSKVVNMILVGAACRSGIMDLEHVKQALSNLVKPQFLELNIKALEYCK